MTILSHSEFGDHLQHKIIEVLNQANFSMDITNQTFSVRNYSNFIESVAEAAQELSRNVVVKFMETMDQEYRESDLRKRHYYIKNTRERTLITVYGQITYKRTIYQDKRTGKTFTYVDRKLGLPRYDRYDPTVKAKVLELFADHNSMIRVGEIIGEQIYALFSTKPERKNFNISRQTVQNIVKRSLLVKPTHTMAKHTPEVLYVMADEKYVPLQNEPTKSAFVRHGVIFEGRELVGNTQGRYALVNRWVYTDLKPVFWKNMDEILHEKYDMEKVKRVYILGDGASWIKQGGHFITKSTFMLDKFHAFQALGHITKDPLIQGSLRMSVLNNQKKNFQILIDYCLKIHADQPARIKTIDEKKTYILNHWNALQLSLNTPNPGCSMESQISHNLAAIFTSRPKAYSLKNLIHYVNTRDMFNNGVDIINLYLDTLHLPASKKPQRIPKETLDFSLFEPRSRYDKSSSSNWTKGFISRN